MNNNSNYLNILAGVLFFAAALAASPLSAATGEDSVEGDTIAWFRGDVEQAFARAKAQDKPLFLYWGAVWCPPCVQIKKTVFASREFIALSELFVPYYLDGDTEEAQATGERFGVKGYPTMIVFNPAGEEITRIPGGIDMERYNSMLRLSLNQMKPTKTLLQQAMNEPDSLTADNYTQLAYYSWGQDFNVLPEGSEPSLFKTLSEQASSHDETASARLFMQYLVSSSLEHSEEEPVSIEGADSRLKSILKSDEQVLACWDSLAYYPEIMDILALEDEGRRQLKGLWQDRLMALRTSEKLSTEEQLAGWLPLLYFHFENSEEALSEPVAVALIEDVTRANESVRIAYARQSLVNQIRWIYQFAHMYDRARELLLAELERSESPYYFMSSLGSLAESQEQNEEAIEWYRKAYETSEGAATRFQWGASYVRAMIRLTPQQDELILTTAESLFDVLPSANEAFSGRNFRVLSSLNDQLAEWQAEKDAEAQGDAVEKRFVSRIKSLCAAEADGSTEKENCQSLLKDETAT